MINLSEIARRVFQAQLKEMQLHLDGCIDGMDPIHLHDFRVANRRTRAALVEFKKLLPVEICQRYQQEFRWIHNVTGPVRDLDVVLSHYRTLRKEVPKPWRPYIKNIMTLIDKKRFIAHEELSTILLSDKFRSVLGSWSVLLDGGISEGTPLSVENAKEYGSLRIVKRYRRLQNSGQGLNKNSAASDYHDYRIQVKKLRYLMEFFRPAMDQEDFERIRTNLKTVQDTFGVFQDTDIQIQNLRVMAEELFEQGSTVETLLTLGQLLGFLEKRLSQAKKKCLKQTRMLISDSSARSFQSCFQYPVD